MNLFFDKNWGQNLPLGLRRAGLEKAASLTYHKEQGFSPTTPDEEWLNWAATNDYTVLSFDRLDRNQLALDVIKTSGARCFNFAPGHGAANWARVELLARAWPFIDSCSDPPPFIWRLQAVGNPVRGVRKTRLL